MAWTEKLPSGRYRGGYRIPNGQKRYTAETFTHKARALREANHLEAESRTLGWRDPQAAERTWGEWAEEWLPHRIVAPSTADAEKYLVPKLIERWGDTPLHEITRYAVKAWAAELLESGKAHGTVLKYINLLSTSLTAAADAEIIPANPALRLKLGLVAGHSERTLTREEQHRLFEAFTPRRGASTLEHAIALRDQAIVATLLGTGARWGEAIALAAFHFDHGEVRYRRAWNNTRRTMKPYTKGKKRRSVPLAPWLDELTQPAREAAPRGLLFVDADGNPPNSQNWLNRSWYPALERAGLNQGEHDDRVTRHTLRHTYATEQLEAGRSIAEIADLLGHSSLSMAERYAHRRSQVNPAAAHAIPDPRIAPPADGPLPPNVTQVDFGSRRA